MKLFKTRRDKKMKTKEKMKAIVSTKYGSPEVLQLKKVDKPTPKENEVLIKINATTVTMGDCEMRSLKFSGLLKFLMQLAMGFRKPRKKYAILGQELAGEIVSIGNKVKKFKRGDSVFASTGFHFGAYAEYICLTEKAVIAIKPDNITYQEAAAVPTGGLEALHYIRKAKVQKGQTILIRGASGSIGTVAIQLAKYYGANVTGVGNPRSLEVMKSIGADRVIDYIKEDFTQSGVTYDIIFDVIGKSSISSYLNSLNKNGTYINANPKMSLINRDKRIARKNDIKFISGNTDDRNEMIEQLLFLKELFENGKLKSVIDRSYSLEQIVEAHSYVEEGEKTGNVIINVIK
jgi:NADPH:quinone reductase-like Zn-dependent oxidoreductase